MRRPRLLVLLVTLVLLLAGGGAAASAATGPNVSYPCRLAAGRMVVSTSTATRSINVRWPGLTCYTLVSELAAGPTQLDIWNGSTFVVYSTVNHQGYYYNTNTVPSGSAVLHCVHKAMMKVQIDYKVWDNGSPVDSLYWTNAAVCS